MTGRLGHVQAALRRQEEGDPPPAAPDGVDYTPLLQALEAIRKQIEGVKTPKPADLKQPVQALLKGLEPLLKAPEIDLTPLVKAVEGLEMPAVQFPEASPYTFHIDRDQNGFLERVVARPGVVRRRAKPKPPEPDYD